MPASLSQEIVLIVLFLGLYGVVYLVAFFLPYARLASVRGVDASLDAFVDGLQREQQTPGALSVKAPAPAASGAQPLGERERLGQLYVQWCQTRCGELDGANARIADFEAFLQEVFHRGVSVAGVDREGDVFQTSNKEPRYLPMWLVLGTNEDYLLPKPLTGGFVSVGESFLVEETATPATLGSAYPARVELADSGWSLADGGVLSTGSAAEVIAEAAPEAPRYDAEVRTLEPLAREYDSPYVEEAVQQIKAAYPAGDYRRFDLLRLPSYAEYTEYTERLQAARNMAGLFVLLGLGVTLYRLNDVVSGLSEMAGSGAMDKDAFVQSMGEQLGGIGGAFSASIWGIGLMVAAFLLLGFMDRRAQKAFAQIERTMAEDALPVLVHIQERDMKVATLPEILRATQQNLGQLSVTVRSLSDGLDSSLAGLSDRIADMLNKFGSFDDRYVKLDDILRSTSDAASRLAKASERLDASGQALRSPLAAFQGRIDALLELQTEALGRTQLDYDRLASEMQAVQVSTHGAAERAERLLQQALSAVQTQQQQQAQEQAAQLSALQEGLAQFVHGARSFQPTATALQAAADAQARVTQQMHQSAARFADSGETMRRAAQQFQRNGPQTVPPSLFSWLYNGLVSLGEKASGTPPAEWERAPRTSGDGAPAPSVPPPDGTAALAEAAAEPTAPANAA